MILFHTKLIGLMLCHAMTRYAMCPTIPHTQSSFYSSSASVCQKGDDAETAGSISSADRHHLGEVT